MKLKFYLRGLGVGMILTALVMAAVIYFQNGTGILQEKKAASTAASSKAASSNAASSMPGAAATANGEVAASTGIAASTSKMVEGSSEETSANPLAGQEVAAAGEEISKEVNQTEPTSAAYLPQNVETLQETKEPAGEDQTQLHETASAAAENDNKPVEDSGQETPPGTDNTTTVTIPGGVDSARVCNVLQSQGLIDNADAFNSFLEDEGYDRAIKSGTKNFPADGSFEEIAGILTAY